MDQNNHRTKPSSMKDGGKKECLAKVWLCNQLRFWCWSCCNMDKKATDKERKYDNSCHVWHTNPPSPRGSIFPGPGERRDHDVPRPWQDCRAASSSSMNVLSPYGLLQKLKGLLCSFFLGSQKFSDYKIPSRSTFPKDLRSIFFVFILVLRHFLFFSPNYFKPFCYLYVLCFEEFLLLAEEVQWGSIY